MRESACTEGQEREGEQKRACRNSLREAVSRE